MSIQVIYSNGNMGHATADMLDYLIEAGDITSFKRRNGWVMLGCEKIRDRDTLVFSIPERRSSMNALLASNLPLLVHELR